MGWQDRAYYRDDMGGGMMGRLRGKSVVTWLLAINVLMFFLQNIFDTAARLPAITPWFAFETGPAVPGLQLWRFVTYQFLHWGLLHLVFNMIGLYFFGPMMEQWWGSARFLAFYLLCGVAGAALFAILESIPGLLPGTGFMLGASGAVFGIIVGCATLFPRHEVRLLFPPITMTMRTMALVFLGLALLSVIGASRNAGGEAAHLGGAAAGFVFVKWPALLGWSAGGFNSFGSLQQRVRQVRRDRQQQREASLEQEVDRILEKVKQHGLQSLTRSEKRTLSEATERQRRAS